MPEVAFLELGRGARALRHELRAAVDEVLEAGRFILGDRGAAFETAFAAYCGVAEAVGVSSGTAALRLALSACGIGPADEVLTVANTSVPTAAAICATGARPVFVDVDPRTATMDPAALPARPTRATRAIVPVHLYGQCADMAPIVAFARRHGLRVVEDCAQAHGARYQGRMAGTMGDAAAFSFYPTKNLGALGDAGMVVSNDVAVTERVRALRAYGTTSHKGGVVRGGNERLDELQAAILLVKLRYLNDWNERRRALAAIYNKGLADAAVTRPHEALERHHVYHLYVVRVRERERFRARLLARGVETLVHYPVPLHRHDAYAAFAPAAALPATDALAAEIVSLPLYAELRDAEAEQVIDAVREAAA
jgi:dTDP-4-amino-4,6-dideoxygalactose transaminase